MSPSSSRRPAVADWETDACVCSRPLREGPRAVRPPCARASGRLSRVLARRGGRSRRAESPSVSLPRRRSSRRRRSRETQEKKVEARGRARASSGGREADCRWGSLTRVSRSSDVVRSVFSCLSVGRRHYCTLVSSLPAASSVLVFVCAGGQGGGSSQRAIRVGNPRGFDPHIVISEKHSCFRVLGHVNTL